MNPRWTKLPASGKITSRNTAPKSYLEDFTLANTKSAIKRVRQNAKRRVRNRYFTGRTRTFMKKANLAIEEGGVEAARSATLVAISALDKAAEKGILHKNNASRRKSRLMHRLAELEKKA